MIANARPPNRMRINRIHCIEIENSKTVAERFIVADKHIEFFDSLNEPIEFWIIWGNHDVLKAFKIKGWLSFKESKSSSEGVINHGKAAVRSIHLN